MKIFVYGSTLTVFTSSIPTRGLIVETIKLRPNDDFILYFNSHNINIPYMKKFFNEIRKYKNVQLFFDLHSKRLSNFKALLGFQNYLNIRIKADLYISPGTVNFFGKEKLPLINVLTDLSLIKTAECASTPWHGKYIFKNLLKYSVKYASKIVCMSAFTENDLHTLYPHSRNKTQMIYNGIEQEWFDNKYEELKIEGFTNSINSYWIWYGYISKRKNIVNLLKAYESLIEENNKIKMPKLLLIGKLAPNQISIAEHIRRNFKKNIKLIPHQDIYCLKYLVKKSKGLVFPSYYEGFGLPVIEAYSQGVPVMHSNISSLPEIAGGLGISCDPYDIESIKSGLMRLANEQVDEEYAAKRKTWAGKFTYHKAALEFSKVIDDVVSKSYKQCNG